jgi:hypothetical protein
MFFINEYTGWIGGSYGLMCKTTNGGYNWLQENVSHFGNGYFGDLFFYNDTIGWAVGAPGKILYTETGGQITKISNINTISSNFELFQNYPNPFNASTKIKFDIPMDDPKGTPRFRGNDKVVLKVYDVMGREVETLVSEVKQAGYYSVDFNGSALASGVYFYRIVSGDFVMTKRMILLK